MSFITAAVIGAVGVVGGALIAGNAASSAANTQAGAAENAQQISQNEFNTVTAQEQPFLQGGYSALNALEYGLGLQSPQAPAGGTGGEGGLGGLGGMGGGGFRGGGRALVGGGAPLTGIAGGGGTPPAGGPGFGALNAPFTLDTFKQFSPAYQFQLQQGQQGVLNADTSSQGALSGAALKDLTSFNQNYANTAFNNAFNQYQTQQSNIYSRLAGLTQIGSSAAANLGAQGVQLAGQQAQSAQNIGTALAGGQVGAANAYSGALAGLGTLGMLTQNPYGYLGTSPPNDQGAGLYGASSGYGE